MSNTNAAESFHDRHVGLLDPTSIGTKRVLLFGAGSVGSVLAGLLCRTGIGHWSIYDMDRVSPSNLCRTAYRQRDIGRLKVEALAEVLGEICPNIDVVAHDVDLRQVDDDILVGDIERSDVVIVATDHPPTQARVNALAYHLRPALYIGVFAKGEGGEVILTIPELTPCYGCVIGSLRGEQAPNRGKVDYGLTTGQLASEPALGIDIAHVTSCAAKIALALLLRGSGFAAETVINPEFSVLFVGNTASWIFDEPFQTVWGRAERRKDCVCQLKPGTSTAALLD